MTAMIPSELVYVYHAGSVADFRRRWVESVMDYQRLVDQGKIDGEKAVEAEPESPVWQVFSSIRDVVGAPRAPSMSEMFA